MNDEEQSTCQASCFEDALKLSKQANPLFNGCLNRTQKKGMIEIKLWRAMSGIILKLPWNNRENLQT